MQGKNQTVVALLTFFRMGLLGAAHIWGEAKKAPSLKYVTHILQWWNLAQLHFTKGRSKLSSNLNDIVDVVMLPNIGNSSISMREVVLTSILYGLDQKNLF